MLSSVKRRNNGGGILFLKFCNSGEVRLGLNSASASVHERKWKEVQTEQWKERAEKEIQDMIDKRDKLREDRGKGSAYWLEETGGTSTRRSFDVRFSKSEVDLRSRLLFVDKHLRTRRHHINHYIVTV